MIEATARDDERFKLRVEAQASMALALGCLDQLGDEGPAAATLQHAIDRLSCQGADNALALITDLAPSE
jgi:hypothetical protein